MKKFFRKKLNSKGAASIFMVMMILAAVLAISLGSSFVASTETRLSSDSNESVAAYYAAETGIEFAMYEFSQNREPASAACVMLPASCTPDPSTTFPVWTNVGAGQYYINITGCVCTGTISEIQAIGKYKSTQRSIEVNLGP